MFLVNSLLKKIMIKNIATHTKYCNPYKIEPLYDIIFYTDSDVGLPNLLTIIRIILTPLICYAISQPLTGWYAWISCVLFFIASFTDFADGYIAKKINAHSYLGAILDPLADKILMGMVLFFLASCHYFNTAEIWVSSLLIIREFCVLSLRSAVSAKKLPVIQLARAKTLCQFLALFLYLLPAHFPGYLFCKIYAAPFCLWLSLGLSLVTGFLYMKTSFSILLSPSKKSGGQ